MATIKSYTDLEQSRKLSEILPLESADMHSEAIDDEGDMVFIVVDGLGDKTKLNYGSPIWSLAALLKYLSEIKPQVYTPILFPSKAKWILQFAEYGHGNVCEVSCENPIDACVAMIERLHELNLL